MPSYYYQESWLNGVAFYVILPHKKDACHYNDITMGAMASQITSLTIVYSTVYSGAVQRKHQSSASLAFIRGIYRWPVNSPHKVSEPRKIFPFDDVIIQLNTHSQNVAQVASQTSEKSTLLLYDDINYTCRKNIQWLSTLKAVSL